MCAAVSLLWSCITGSTQFINYHSMKELLGNRTLKRVQMSNESEGLCHDGSTLLMAKLFSNCSVMRMYGYSLPSMIVTSCTC